MYFFWSLKKKKKKQGNKKEKLTESLHLTVKMARRSNYNIDLRKLRIYKTKSLPKPQSGSKLKTYRLSAMITSFAVQFSIEDKDNFAVYDKDYQNV